MADVSVRVIEPAEGPPAEDMSFMSLAEAKLLFGIDEADETWNAEQIRLQIAINSAIIMRACNRSFMRETIAETWRDLGSRRLFLTHWPVKEEDIESVRAGGQTLSPEQYELEETSGKLSNFAGWNEPVVVTYTGGFQLPDEAPLALKQASVLLLRHVRQEASREAIAGIRMIAHKESRVMLFDPSTQQKSAATIGTLGTGVLAADQLLYHYMRFWI